VILKSVTTKPKTLRRATASSVVKVAPETIGRMQANDLPKKDVLIVARVAGVTAAKKTPDVIPYCHPLPIDSVAIEFEVGDDRIGVIATVEAIWKTGVEMEALCAASVAALTIYDMLKPVDKNIVIESTKLDKKRGGKTSFHDPLPEGFTAAVIVTSDGTFEGTREDKSGRILRGKLESYGIEPLYIVLPDEIDQIEKRLRELIADGTDLVLTTGGTGLSPRDVTVEATRRVIEREAPGIVEACRTYGQERTPYAMLSRGLAGVAGKTLIVNMPGSSKGAEESANAVFPGIFHAYSMLRGGGH
jgi:molybdenum cofactor biosynthesis protein MoaC